MPTIFVFFFILIMFYVSVNVLAFVLAVLGFGKKTQEEQHSRGVDL